MKFLQWLAKSKNNSAFEEWLIAVAYRYKLRNLKDFAIFLYHYPRKNDTTLFYPLCDRFLERLNQIFTQYKMTR